VAYTTVPSSWLQLSLRTDPSALDAVSNFLIERGSPGVVIKSNVVQAYFPQAEDSAAVRNDVQRFMRAIQRTGAKVGENDLRWRILKDRNWNSAWRRFFHPQRVGQKFLITPPWVKPQRIGLRQLIMIEPGMAFGTGTHATTRGCIEYIEKVAASFRGSAFNALDVGTGSGILSIALAKLGAQPVLAIDNDPLALKVASENLALNGVEGKVRLSDINLNRVRKTFSVVVANLTAETILNLARRLETKVSPRGSLILSGIFQAQADAVAARFERSGFTVVRRKRDKEWMTLLLRRKTRSKVQRFKSSRSVANELKTRFSSPARSFERQDTRSAP
jgi:ribosomal protein L11 methyltransferase